MIIEHLDPQDTISIIIIIIIIIILTIIINDIIIRSSPHNGKNHKNRFLYSRDVVDRSLD